MASLKGKKNPRYRTGLTMDRKGEHGGIYNSWQNMKGRCLRASHPKYHRYGGRGIQVTDEWLDIKGFYKWALNSGWKKGLTLDRINNDGNYSANNCQWVSASENSRKKSTTKLSRGDADEIRVLSLMGLDNESIAKRYNVSPGSVWFIKEGYTHVSDGLCSKKLSERQS